MLRTTVASLILLATSSMGMAQCEYTVQSLNGLRGTDGGVGCLIDYDPDGAGPQASVLVVAGAFTTAGRTPASNIASFDPATGTWAALGEGTDAIVHALAIAANGDLIAAGEFAHAGGIAAARIARWDGSNWHAYGEGITGGVGASTSVVRAIKPLSDGRVVAGGLFNASGEVLVNNIAIWDGTSWAALGLGTEGGVLAIEATENGDIVAGGHLTMAGGLPVRSIARWNGTTWLPLGEGTAEGVGGPVYSLLNLPGSGLVVAGQFFSAAGQLADCIARWNGTAWTSFDFIEPHVHSVRSLIRTGDGEVRALADMNGDFYADQIIRSSGTSWSSYTYASSAWCIAELSDGQLFSGMSFEGDYPVSVLRWTGTNWVPLSEGFQGRAYAVAAAPNGDYFLGGRLSSAVSQPGCSIARFGNNGLEEFSAGLTGDLVDTLIVNPSGKVFAAGNITAGDGTQRIAQWNGTTWTGVGGFTGGSVNDFAVLPDGSLVVGGSFTMAGSTPAESIARWDGAVWSPLGAGISNTVGSVGHLAVHPNGDLLVSGGFDRAGGIRVNGFARWNGSSWTGFGTGIGTGRAGGPIAVSPAGEIYTIKRLNGDWFSQWSPSTSTWVQLIIANSVKTMCALPNGDVLLGGSFSGLGTPPLISVPYLARWSAGTWSRAASGIDRPVNSIRLLPNSDVLIAGEFQHVGTVASPLIAVLSCGGCRADFNGDNVADFFDYLDFVAALAAQQIEADVNGDGTVDLFDYLDFVQWFATGC